MALLLNVPYAEKNEAKALGAKWNPKLKKWYVTNTKEYYKFIKWFIEEYKEQFLICDYIFLVDKDRKCPYCGTISKEVKILITEYYHFYDEPDNNGMYYEYCSNSDLPRIVDLSAVKKLIKGKVLDYLNNYYNIKMEYGRLSQRCKHCGRQIRISPSSDFGIHSLDETKKFTLYKFFIDEDIFVDDLPWCSSDVYIFSYSKKIIPN